MRRWRFPFAGAKFLLAGALVAGAFVVTSDAVNADGAARKAAPTAQAPTSWSGLYFGAHAGWAWAEVESDLVTVNGTPLGWNDSVHHDAPVVGGQIGLQHQFGLFVLGVEASATFAYEDGYGNVTCPDVGTRTCGKRFDNVLSVGPRLGYAMGKWMPYLTGGYASAEIAHKSFDTGAQTNVHLFGERFSGWYVGAGVDMAIAQGWTVGLEYRHYDFGSDNVQTFNASLPNQGTGTGQFRDVEATLDTLALRVSWKLGRPEPAKPLK